METSVIKQENEDLYCNEPILNLAENNFMDSLDVIDLKVEPNILYVSKEEMCQEEKYNLRSEYFVKNIMGEPSIKNEEIEIKTEEKKLEK